MYRASTVISPIERWTAPSRARGGHMNEGCAVDTSGACSLGPTRSDWGRSATDLRRQSSSTLPEPLEGVVTPPGRGGVVNCDLTPSPLGR